MRPLEVRADEACCEVCGQGGEDVALTVCPRTELVTCRRCRVWDDLLAPRLGVA